MTKYNIVFEPTDKSYLPRVISTHTSYEEAAKNVEQIENMRENKTITCFVNLKDSTGIEWISNLEGKIKIQRVDSKGCCIIV